MSDEHDENATETGPGSTSWPVNLPKGTNINDTDPLQATHPTVIAVCNVLMFDGPVDYKAWHCPAEHVRTRETMEQCISHLILQRRPSASQEWIEKLPEVSKRIEKNLYFSARSIDEYSDPYTLVNRIQDLVKVLITAAATLPIPGPGSSSGDEIPSSMSTNAHGDDQEVGEVDGNQENESEPLSTSVRVKTEAVTSSTPDQAPVIPTGLAQLLGASNAEFNQTPLYLIPLKEAELAQQQSVAVASSVLQQPQYLASSQVSSQGCSRVFIIKVLISVSEFVKGKSLPSIFTFKRELVMDWLISAKQACCLPTYMAEEGYYGGPPFVNPDPSTHWSEPHQLYTWWKNNVERRSKFKVLQEDAKFKGLDPRRLQRARWCEAVVALSELIRASSGSSNASRTAQQTSSAVSNAASQATALALSGNPLTNSTAYIQALTASMARNNPNNEDTTSESSGNGNGSYYHLAGLPSFAQVHSATSADDRSGIDALMLMSNEMNNFLAAYGTGKGPPLPQGLQVTMQNPLEGLTGVRSEDSEEKKASFDPYSLQNTPFPSSFLPQQHLYPNNSSSYNAQVSSSQADQDLLLNGLTPGLSVAMQNAGLSLDSKQTPLLNKFMPPPSNLIIGTHIIPGTNIPYRNYSNTFPVKLFDLVSSEEEGVVGWQGHGTSFQVRDMDRFVNVVLPKHFKHNNFTSFQRQLNLYGFRRSASYDKGAYYHPQFQQGQRELAESIRRVLAPNASGGDKDGGAPGPYTMSASALAMSYLSTLPPGASVTMPGVPGGPGAGASGSDGAAESLLSMGGPLSKTSAGSSSGGPVPLPLPTWLSVSAAGAAPADTGPGSAYWQNMVNNPYLLAQQGANAAYPQYPGLGGIGIDGATGAYGFSGAMSMLQNQGKVFKVPARGYNRNSNKRGTEGEKEGGARKTKLSARDRKLLDMSSSFNAEQFLASTVISDRYNLGTHNSSLTAHPHHHSHHHDKKSTEEGEGKRGRGRPSKKRPKPGHTGSSDEYDEATYQDGEEEGLTHHRTHRSSHGTGRSRRVKSSRKAEDDSESSASDTPALKGRRTSGTTSRNSSYKNLPLDVLAKSGLSRHSAITHLTQDAAEDLLDLRNPQRRRVYLDFTVTGHLGEAAKSEGEGDALDYVCGFYRGALTQGKKDIGLHYQLHGSRALPEALLRVNSEITAAAVSPAQSLSSMIAAQNKNNLPRSTRVGEDYQSDIPVLSAVPTSVTTQGLSRRSNSSTSVSVWRPNELSTECVDAFVELLHARKKLIPLPVGTVLVVHLKDEKAYRLCCVLDVYFADPTPRDLTESTPRTPATPALGKLLEGSTVRVFDGYEDWVVPSAECMLFKEGEMELALQLLIKHEGQITPTLVQEVDWLLQSGVCSEGSVFAVNSAPPTSWTADEVLRFCTAVKRYGDNIKKVWELRFEDSKSIEEVQEFFLQVYPHTQLGGAKRVVSVFSRGELAAAGYPDGEASSSESEGEGESVSGSPTSSRSSSISNTNSDDDDRSTSASRGTSSEVGSALNAQINISTTTVAAVTSGKANTSRSSKTSSTNSAPAPATGSSRRSSGALPTPVEEVDTRRSGRKRTSVSGEEAPAVSIPTHALVPSAVDSTRKRRR